MCAGINSSFNTITETALKLSDYAIAPRYPHAFDDLTIEDARQAYEDAISIKNFVLKYFVE